MNRQLGAYLFLIEKIERRLVNIYTDNDRKLRKAIVKFKQNLEVAINKSETIHLKQLLELWANELEAKDAIIADGLA